MVKVYRGLGYDGKPCRVVINHHLKDTLDMAIERVTKHNWDYVCVIAGLPGSGKSTFARTPAKYCCKWFDESYIAFTGDDFIRITNDCPKYSSVILDESFQSMNSKVTMTEDFLRIINHLQIIRQKNLFIFLCLPNFFDLSKNIAVFRTSHLFVVYATDEGQRGRFMAFGRKQKRKLYILGNRFMDYDCVRSNFNGSFSLNPTIINDKLYEDMKMSHLQSQRDEIGRQKREKAEKNKQILTEFIDFVVFMMTKDNIPVPILTRWTKLTKVQIFERRKYLKRTNKWEKLVKSTLNYPNIEVKVQYK